MISMSKGFSWICAHAQRGTVHTELRGTEQPSSILLPTYCTTMHLAKLITQALFSVPAPRFAKGRAGSLVGIDTYAQLNRRLYVRRRSLQVLVGWLPW